MYIYFMCAQIEALEVELEEVCRRAAQFEEEAAEESQGMDLQLMDSQVGGTHHPIPMYVLLTKPQSNCRQ